MSMSTKVRRGLASLGILAAVVSGGVVADTATAPEAQAGPNKVCNWSPYDDPAMGVLEEYGAQYNLYPGQCTPDGIRIAGIRPPGPNWAIYYYRNGENTRRACYHNNWQWCSTLWLNISVTRVFYATGGGKF